MAGSGEDSPGRYGEGSYLAELPLVRQSNTRAENFALVSPDRDWQDRLQNLLSNRQNMQYAAPQAPAPYALPSFRQLSSPVPSPQPHQQQQQQQSHQLMQSTLPVTYSTKLEGGSPGSNPSMLAPMNAPSYHSHSPQPQYHSQQQHQQQPHTHAQSRLSWDGFNGYQRLGDAASEDGEPKGRYELAPADSHLALGGAGAGARDAYQSLPRVQESATSVSLAPFFEHRPAADACAYSDGQRWYYPNQQAVG